MSSIIPLSATDFSVNDGGNYQAMRGIATSSSGSIIYVSMTSVDNVGVVKSTDNGLTWNVVNSNSGYYCSIACSADGTIVYLASLGDGLYKSIDSGSTWNRVSFIPNNNLPGGSLNPEVSDSHFGGYDLTNIYQVACDSTGTKLIMTTNAAASIYRSIDGGLTWSFLYAIPNYSTNPTVPTIIASNGDGTILYAALNNTTGNIIVSKNSGVSWTGINMLGLSGPFGTLSTNSYGDFVFGVDTNSYLNIFYPTHTDKALLVPSSGNTLVAVATYNSGNNIIISQNTYQSISNGAVVIYSIANKYYPANLVPTPTPTATIRMTPTPTQPIRNPPSNVCFVANTRIETDQGKIPIQLIQPGLHTIRSKRILAVSKTTSLDKELVFIPIHSIGNSESMTLSKNHLIYSNGFKMACELSPYIVPYQGQLLYNIVMEEHDIIMVADMPCETLHPSNPIATLFRMIEEEKFTMEEQDYIFTRYQMIEKKLKRNSVY